MEHNISKDDERRRKQREKAYKKTCDEYLSEIKGLRERSDYLTEFEYFLNLSQKPLQSAELKNRVNKDLIALFCIQAPLELFDALDLHAIKLTGGSHAAQRLSVSSLPVLMCPMLKSYIGSLGFEEEGARAYAATILPTTCDWVVKFPEIVKGKIANLHYLELPHVKQTEKSQSRWLEEIFDLKIFLENLTGRKLQRQNLISSQKKYMEIWGSFQELIACKRKNILADIWFTVIANTFMLDKVDVWHEKLKLLLDRLQTAVIQENPYKVFLAGSPIIFPNLKILQLIEQAGMSVCADDLCSSERIFPGATLYSDASVYGILKALAERNHKACICPTFTDNDRRVNNILRLTSENNIKGVIFHILKGCHPYDIESITIEEKLKNQGIKFLKLETDYVKEDSQNILTRLEAFKQTL